MAPHLDAGEDLLWAGRPEGLVLARTGLFGLALLAFIFYVSKENLFAGPDMFSLMILGLGILAALYVTLIPNHHIYGITNRKFVRLGSIFGARVIDLEDVKSVGLSWLGARNGVTLVVRPRGFAFFFPGFADVRLTIGFWRQDYYFMHCLKNPQQVVDLILNLNLREES